MDAIVVTGIGAVTPLGTGRAAIWRAFAAGESGVRELAADDPRRDRAVDPSPLPAAGRAGWVRGFQPRELVRSPLLRRMDWGSRMLVAATRGAFEDAALLPLSAGDRGATAIVAGSYLASQRDTAAYLERIHKAGVAAGQPFVFPNLVLNAAAGYAAIELEIEGPNLSVSAHDASGEAALAAAVDLLRAGACEIACAGGFDELGDVLLEELAERRILDLEALPAERRAAARVRGRGLGGGIVPGEGAAMLVLETAAHARRRGARVYAELVCARTAAVAAPPYGLATASDEAADRLVDLALAELRARAGDGAGGTEDADARADADAGEAREPGAAITAILGNADGSAPRAALDAALRRAVARHTGAEPAYVAFRRLTGEWGAAGALGAALAALSIAERTLPGAGEPGGAGDPADPGAGERRTRAILVAGAARSGVVAPVVLARPRS